MNNREETIKSLENLCVRIGRGTGKNSLYLTLMNALHLLKKQPDVVRCKDCKYWGKESGLTARKCSQQGIITEQFDFCSYGRTAKQNGSN